MADFAKRPEVTVSTMVSLLCEQDSFRRRFQ